MPNDAGLGPRRVAAPVDDLPLHGVAASRRIERSALAALPPHTLMRRAGAAVARLALALAPHARTVWIAAGPGNNGGDGFEAALGLAQPGGRDARRAVLTFVGDPAKLPPDAADAYARARAAGLVITTLAAGDDGAAPSFTPPLLGPDDLAIDALLGLGAGRPPSGAVGVLVAALNAVPCTVLAVDLPTGLDGDTGQPVGGADAGGSGAGPDGNARNVAGTAPTAPASDQVSDDPTARCVRAHHTLSLLTLKPGLYTGHGRDLAGTAWLDDLGIDVLHGPHGISSPDAWLTGSARAAAVRAPRRHAQHKGSFGDVAVVGGAPGMTGAALLAARAALAAGAGRVYLSLLDPSASAFDPTRPELMWRDRWWETADDATLARTTVVCGCGGGSAVAAALPRLLERVPRLVLDADALNAIASDAMLRSRLVARSRREGRATVLTPHPLEAARLLGTDAATVQSDRLHHAQALADDCACVVVLKGSGTLTATPGEVPFVNPTGTAALATAGTGDVLAGWTAGVWSRLGNGSGLAPVSAVALQATVAAVYGHGAAADRASVFPLRAAQLVESLLGLADRAPESH